MVVDWWIVVGMVLAATLVATASLLIAAALLHRQNGKTTAQIAGDSTDAVFLFDGEVLVDASPGARFLIASGDLGEDPWLRLVARLGPIFPDFTEKMKALPDEGKFVLCSEDGSRPQMLLRGEFRGGLSRLTLIDDETEQRRGRSDSVVEIALQKEVRSLRNVVGKAPVLIWVETASGDVTWANHAYLLRAADLLPPGQDLSWPLPRVFDMAATTLENRAPRQKLDLEGGTQWFDLVVTASGDDRLIYALPSNAAVQAEGSLREFMQTLTKTFANLPIGLAIFDRDRVLQLFNPALVDLTSLPPDFLIARPSLSAVLDAMRDRAMIPEPKDYRTWRKQMLKVEADAASGLFEETWSLPSGQIYRVIGRPHPNGALAFMFEDVSSEMLRTRRYRADLKLGQDVIDAMDEAVAVFSQGGQLVMSNIAYSSLWNHDPGVLLSAAGIGSLSDWWKEHSAPSLIWGDAMDYVMTAGDRAPWEGEVRLNDGRQIGCRFRPITGGATLITFRILAGDSGGLGLQTTDGTLRRA